MSVTKEHAVAVLGGGPAGCAAALLLARHGHDVCLVRPGEPPAGDLAESVPPSARRVLDELGLTAAVERAGFHPNGGNLVWWAGGGGHCEQFPAGRVGFHADRAGLERVLAEAAREAGVQLYDDASAHEAEEREAEWRIRCVTESGSVELRAPWVLDATGRRGVIARREGRQADRETTTTALVRRWHRAGGFGDASSTRTLVESYVDGWAWSVPLTNEVRCVTAMVDHRHTELDESDLDRTLEAELAKTPHVGALLAGARPLGSTWACPASLYVARRFARPGLLLVGDAGSFIDPLSSFGVKKALSSGWLAGVTAHTALVDPAMSAPALELYEEREREVYRSSRRLAAVFFEEAARVYGHPYWRVRAEASRREAGREGPVSDAGFHHAGPLDSASDPAREDATAAVSATSVRAAMERIRTRGALGARKGATMRALERPTVVGHRIVWARHLASRRVPRGLRYVRNVDLTRLVDVAPLHAEVPDGWRAYNETAPAVALPDYLTALATAFAAGLLEHDDAVASGPRSARTGEAVGAR